MRVPCGNTVASRRRRVSVSGPGLGSTWLVCYKCVRARSSFGQILGCFVARKKEGKENGVILAPCSAVEHPCKTKRGRPA
jgi:hypothetical protein